ncbi:MAG TPA: GAF domain-containing sensor histidine kinase [Chroococcidiopsis sp.]
MVTSPTADAALQMLPSLLGNALWADYCLVIELSAAQQMQEPYVWCKTGDAAVSQCARLQRLLTHPSIEHHWNDAEILIIPNLRRLSIAEELIQSIQCAHSHFPTPQPLSKPADPGSILAIRTHFQGRPNGIILLARAHPYCWKEPEVQLLKDVSDQVAIAVSQAKLEQQIQQQIRCQTVIDQLTTAIRSNLELSQLFQLSVEGTVSSLQASRGLLLTFKYADLTYRHRPTEWSAHTKAAIRATIEYEFAQLNHFKNGPGYYIDQAEHPQPADSKPLGQSIQVAECALLKRVFETRPEPLAIPTLHHPPGSPAGAPVGADAAPEGEAAAADEAIATAEISAVFAPKTLSAHLLVPLENQGTLLGCLVLQHHQPRFWQPEEITFVKLVAAQLSTAIIQTLALRQVHALVEERTSQLQRSLDVQAKLYEKTRQQVDQLRQLTQRQEEFLSTVSHELLTPLTSMTVAIRMLRQADLPPERRSKYLDILEQQCTQETSLINDLLALQKLETGALNTRFHPLDVRYLIRDIARSFEERWVSKRLSLFLDIPERPVNLLTDPESLTRILTELLTNAGKYAEPDSVITLAVEQELDQKSNGVTIYLSNTGGGITPEEMPRIFDRFSRGEGITQQAIPGTGLGLALVKGLVEHLNGSITASSCPIHQGKTWQTCFRVNLPQSPTQGAVML